MRWVCLLVSFQITMNRPERRNAFRPRTVKEMIWAFGDSRDDTEIGVVILTGMVRFRQCYVVWSGGFRWLALNCERRCLDIGNQGIL